MKYCPTLKTYISDDDCGVCEMCPDQKIRNCPKCPDGTLEILTARELLNNGYDVNQEVWGCDECKYAEDHQGYPIIKKSI